MSRVTFDEKRENPFVSRVLTVVYLFGSWCSCNLRKSTSICRESPFLSVDFPFLVSCWFFYVCISFARFRLPVYLAQNSVYHVLWYLGVPWLGQLGFLVERPSAFSYWNQTWLSRFSRFVLFAAIKRLFVMTAGLTVILPRQSSPRWTCRGSAGKNKDDRETNTFCRSHKAGHGFIEQPGVERDAEG